MLHQYQLQARNLGFDNSPSTAQLEIRLETAVSKRFPRDSEICGAGTGLKHFFKVAGGVVRSVALLADGKRQVVAFYVPGDMFGLTVAHSTRFSLEAATNAEIIVFQRAALMPPTAVQDGVSDLWQHANEELDRSYEHMLLLTRSATERVAAFLLDMARRAHSPRTVPLPMPRQDIADYLGLTIETVSRVLTQMESAGAIHRPTHRQVTLLRPEKLQAAVDAGAFVSA